MKRLFGLASVAIFSLSVAQVASANVGSATKAAKDASNTAKIGTVSKMSKADASNLLKGGVALSSDQSVAILGVNGKTSVAQALIKAKFIKNLDQRQAFLEATARGVMKSDEVVACLQGIANEKNAADRQIAFDRLAKIVAEGSASLRGTGDTVASATARSLSDAASSMKDVYARELGLSNDVATQEYNGLVSKCSIDSKLAI